MSHFDDVLNIILKKSENDTFELNFIKNSLTRLEACRKDYEIGRKQALIEAIAICATEGFSMPEWVAAPIREAYADNRHHLKSWDDIFDKPKPSGKHAKKYREDKSLKIAIYADILRRKKEGEAIDKELLQKVGETYGIGLTKTTELYSEANKDLKSGRMVRLDININKINSEPET